VGNRFQKPDLLQKACDLTPERSMIGEPLRRIYLNPRHITGEIAEKIQALYDPGHLWWVDLNSRTWTGIRYVVVTAEKNALERVTLQQISDVCEPLAVYGLGECYQDSTQSRCRDRANKIGYCLLLPIYLLSFVLYVFVIMFWVPLSLPWRMYDRVKWKQTDSYVVESWVWIPESIEDEIHQTRIKLYNPKKDQGKL
jgi:hypothetical protein